MLVEKGTCEAIGGMLTKEAKARYQAEQAKGKS